ncbi:MAG: helix-turn-helix domain-containing protein [Anaerolineae bacterium]|nr:helix-turn-helix domain-containing protein [Anaerolineae bacterium]
MTRNDRSRYYTVPEAAEMLEVSPSTVWRWIEAGRLPAQRVGPKNIRIRKEDLAAVITPARTQKVSMEDKERGDNWADYDPEKVREAITETAGSWADLDTDALIANLYRAREEGSRPATRP